VALTGRAEERTGDRGQLKLGGAARQGGLEILTTLAKDKARGVGARRRTRGGTKPGASISGLSSGMVDLGRAHVLKRFARWAGPFILFQLVQVFSKLIQLLQL
jgi:hypothetical protein